MNSFAFQNPTRILFGAGMVDKLGEQLAAFGSKTVLLVYGGGSIKHSGLYDRIQAQISQAGVRAVELPGIEPNPRVTTVRRGIGLCREHDVDFILAVGGGSVLDAAKAVAVGVPYEGDVWDFLMRKAEIRSALPLGTVLTLSATGSEMNGNSVITNWEENLKKSFGSIHAYPKFSILDPTLTYSVPPHQTVNGIVDTMSHVFEQYFSLTENTPLQERLCESILQTVIENGEKALAEPDNYEARANLMLCSTYALNGGMISVGMEQDWATHMIEHEVSALYDIAHAAGLSVLFPNWMTYVCDQRVERFAQYAARVWQINPSGRSLEEVARAGIEATRSYFTRIGAPSTLGELNIGDEHLERMAEETVRFGPVGSFRKLQADDVLNILRSSL
ncbi:Alcohol dehydrogenase YqhD, Fe-dependent ADH family [Paenibacillus sp. UNCCL117]|uniref:iron-containing alcohol dehydrogenase n=1 Tax=unclassified Paenibacillus TaxID=185978 RepID=UPI00088E09A6|nr:MULTISPECIES: iron-containing alcohol dehydrogenase [unclassified Paenibacillus]SDC53533.1 Alcohol dehydrogenase YqhD, Fe-dependent ADH family [Paenibacillus sp. cl123]SFW11166.1 Alcohol dehydrogenase YqhD, Fe-dependent ADH family [Paenibacillus sp. UNCCL117]